MAAGQTKLSEFFSKRKRCDGLQPSKRRKVVSTDDIETVSVAPVPTKTPPVSRRTRSRLTTKVTQPGQLNLNAPKPRQSGTRTTKQSKDLQKSISEAFISKTSVDDSLKSEIKELIKAIPTAASDNHNGSPPCTPTKMRRTDTEEDSAITKKRSRLQKSVVRDLFREESEQAEFSLPSEKSSRKVVSPRRLSTESEEKSSVFTFTGSERTEQTKEQKVRLEQLAKEAFTPKQAPVGSTSKSADLKIMPVLDLEQLKSLKAKAQKEPGALKDKLARCGKLAELKEKLLELSKQQSPRKKTIAEAVASPRKKSLSEAVAASPSKSRLLNVIKNSPLKASLSSPAKSADAKAPAYERFATLAEPVPPGLTLPKHYKVLHDFFSGTDTVVSMLHKRAEVCTFSKLKKAVQAMTHKNFEEKNLGQIKYLYPTAYSFKQEKNILVSGKRTSSYQLTVEANLTQGPGSSTNMAQATTKDGRPDFTAMKILERKNTFYRKLIDLTKKHHKDYLDNLERPITLPDKKLTRWHPRFLVDNVPDVDACDLPAPPNVEVITSAKDALEQARDKFHNPRVLKALEAVASKSNNVDQNILKGQSESSKRNSVPKSPRPSPSKQKSSDGAAIKGVSQSLVDRIRAKEAMKQEAAMFRSPADERKKERMGRLPELVRILRTCFVTQKKPALPLDDVLEKFTDSYRSALGPVEAECHLKLMSELVPEWVSTVQVKKGVFVKIDRNRDINGVIAKLEKLHKQAV